MRVFMFLMVIAALTASVVEAQQPQDFFTIQVVDEDTGRGVPLVELRTTNSILYYTDSNGIVAFHEPGLMDMNVFFYVKSHGYEFRKDGFGIAGITLRTTPGNKSTLQIKRINVAERLYRITGAGIYRDSLLTGNPVPTENPVLNGLVMGQDSVHTAIYNGKMFWIWGDTGKPNYPLGNFHAAGAVSDLPGAGGLDPEVGIDLDYFVNADGFARQMAPMPGNNPTWLGALISFTNPNGSQRLLSGYIRAQGLSAIERGIVEFNPATETFQKVFDFDLNIAAYPMGHPFRVDHGGDKYIYFANALPLIRVQDSVDSFLDIPSYEALTALMPGSTVDQPVIDRDQQGNIRYMWRKGGRPVFASDERQLVSRGVIEPDEALVHLQDAETGTPVLAHHGCVYWNPYRERWIMIYGELFGTSFLGEIWYAEGDTPVGPWVYTRKIVTHEAYDFYNPKYHPEFDKQGGRVIFFEGTYTNMFQSQTIPTPRYDYNQMMYKLDLGDSRMVLPVPVYDISSTPPSGRYATWKNVPDKTYSYRIPFFAQDRSTSRTVPVFEWNIGGNYELRLAPQQIGDQAVFHALPPGTANLPDTTAPLHAFVHPDGRRYYSVSAEAEEGFVRSTDPICHVWVSPTRLSYPIGNQDFQPSASLSGQVKRDGAPFYRCRVYYSGPTNGTMLTDADGKYSFTAIPGNYTVVFNGFNAVPATHQIDVTGHDVFNVDLPYGVTPIYDGFAGSSLDMSKWMFFNMQPMGAFGNAEATITNGVLRLDTTPNRGGIFSTDAFSPVSTHEIIFPVSHLGVNQILNMYGGFGGFGNFVEFGQEGYLLGMPRAQVRGTTNNAFTASWMGFPFAMAAVRTHNYYDFYVDGRYWHSDTSSSLTSQISRIYLYGYQPVDGDTSAFFSAVAAGTPAVPVEKTVGQSRNSPTGEAVHIVGAIVTGKYNHYYHIQSPDRSSAIKVMSFQGSTFDDPNPNVGDVVDVIGRVIHINSEAMLQRVSHKVIGAVPVPEPLVIAHTQTDTLDGEGARIQAMRVKVVGRITAVERDDQNAVTGFFIDDGSNISMWPDSLGIHIPVSSEWINDGWQPPSDPDISPEWATVTGVVTLRYEMENTVPQIRPNSRDDVVIVPIP